MADNVLPLLGSEDRAAPLRVYDWLPGVRDTLGPGLRAVVWVQGCSLRCPGCMVPETWSPQIGRLIPAAELADEILALPDLDGLTVSGGEPTEQPRAVADLLRRVKVAGKNTWVYSGYTLEELVARGDPDTDALLAAADVLVDGRYEQDKAGLFRWRGSPNQRFHHLSSAIPVAEDGGAGNARVEVRLDNAGSLTVIGVPPPGFLIQLRRRLKARGVDLKSDVPWN